MKAILFDLDGTLIDSTKGIVKSFNYAFDALNKQRANADSICSLIGHPLEVMFSRLGADVNKIDEYIKKYKENYQQISIETTSLLPYAKEAIILASSLAPIGIVTTKTAVYSKKILENFGVLKYFSTVVGREDVEHPKPHPEPILKALEKLNINPSKKVFMIGDTPMDLFSASEAKVSSIALLCGHGNKKELEKYTQIIKSNALEAIEFLEHHYRLI